MLTLSLVALSALSYSSFASAADGIAGVPWLSSKEQAIAALGGTLDDSMCRKKPVPLAASPEERAYLERLHKQRDEAVASSLKTGIACEQVVAPVTVGGTVIQLKLSFTTSNQLFRGIANIYEKHVPRSELPVVFSNLRNTFARAYGNPDTERTETNNKGGATVRTTNAIWRSADSYTNISFLESQIPGLSLVLFTQTYLPITCEKLPTLEACDVKTK